MTTNEIRDKLSKFQNTLTMLQKEEKSLVEELKSLGINSIEEAKQYLEKLSQTDINNIEKEIESLEKELAQWMS